MFVVVIFCKHMTIDIFDRPPVRDPHLAGVDSFRPNVFSLRVVV